MHLLLFDFGEWSPITHIIEERPGKKEPGNSANPLKYLLKATTAYKFTSIFLCSFYKTRQNAVQPAGFQKPAGKTGIWQAEPEWTVDS